MEQTIRWVPVPEDMVAEVMESVLERARNQAPASSRGQSPGSNGATPDDADTYQNGWTEEELRDVLKNPTRAMGIVLRHLAANPDWVSTRNGNLSHERSRLEGKGRQYGAARVTRREFLSSVAYWSVGAVPFIVLLLWFLELEETKSAADVTAFYMVVGLFWMVLGLALLIGLFVVVWRGFQALATLGTPPARSHERKRLDQQQTEFENKQREVEGHLEAARQVLASWPPKRVVPFF